MISLVGQIKSWTCSPWQGDYCTAIPWANVKSVCGGVVDGAV